MTTRLFGLLISLWQKKEETSISIIGKPLVEELGRVNGISALIGRRIRRRNKKCKGHCHEESMTWSSINESSIVR